jgi:RimJ/RimL family protein N-acetyltransferase
MPDATPIRSERLELVPLTLAFHRRAIVHDVAGAERELGLPVTVELLESVPARFRIPQLERDPAELPYLARAMVLRDGRPRVIGNIGFHGRPDDHGRAEIGYTVLVEHRRRGFAREAVLALTDWGHAEAGVHTCVASVSPGNAASLALVASLGFSQVGDQWDEEDGLELVFERALPLPRPA